MSILRSITTASKPATMLTLVATVLLLLKILWLNRIVAPAVFVFELGQLVDAVLTSIVASYVFYLIVVHIKEVDDKATVAPYLKKHSRHVVGICESQVVAIGNAANLVLTLDAVTKAQVVQAFSAIAPISSAPLHFIPFSSQTNWMQYLDHHIGRTRSTLEKVLAQIIFLEAHHVKLLMDIDDCVHFLVIPQIVKTPIRNTNLSAFANEFFDYCQACRKLKTYIDANF